VLVLFLTTISALATVGLASLATFRFCTVFLSKENEKTKRVAERVLLKRAFQHSPEKGLEALKRYLKGRPLEVFETCGEDMAQEHFILAMEQILGLYKKNQWDQVASRLNRYEHRFPELILSFDECLDIVDEAQRVVAHPEKAPIPKSYFARVLAGAVLAEIETKTLFFHCALKKPAAVEARLNRWRKIDPAYYLPGAEKRLSSFRENFPNCTPQQLDDQCSETPYERSEIIGGYEVGIAHLCREGKTQGNRDRTGTVDIGGKKVPFFAICDGRGEGLASEFVSSHLQKILQKIFEGTTLATLSDGRLENLLATSSVRLNDMLAQEHGFCGSGTTLAMALIIPRGDRQEVWTVNVGNSRVLLVSKEKTIQLTEDTILTDERFVSSSEKSGIAVYNSKLMGEGLSVARSIGNFYTTPASKAKIMKRDLDSKQETVLVVHCGGLNRVFSSNDLSIFVRSPHSPLEQAKAMVEAASIGTSTDNLSALVVKHQNIRR